MTLTSTLLERILKRTAELFDELGATCNCHGPATGTKHSPDCDSLLSWDHLQDIARSEVLDEDPNIET